MMWATPWQQNESKEMRKHLLGIFCPRTIQAQWILKCLSWWGDRSTATVAVAPHPAWRESRFPQLPAFQMEISSSSPSSLSYMKWNGVEWANLESLLRKDDLSRHSLLPQAPREATWIIECSSDQMLSHYYLLHPHLHFWESNMDIQPVYWMFSSCKAKTRLQTPSTFSTQRFMSSSG